VASRGEKELFFPFIQNINKQYLHIPPVLLQKITSIPYSVVSTVAEPPQNYWARVHWSLLLSNSDPNWHSPVVPRVKPRLKPRYSRISKQHSHEGEPRDYNTEHFIHLRVVAAERKFITNQVQNSKVLQSSIYSNYSNLIVQRKH
jgi:hypothetical protein